MRGQSVAVAASLVTACGACFPTYQSPRVEPRFHVDADAMAISGHRVSYRVNGPDYMVTITPAYGFGRRLELGVPLGAYFGGSGQTYPVLLPYAKLALGNLDQPDHLAIVAQASGSVGVMVGHDRGTWEPQAMLWHVASAGGQHGDFAFSSRYAQDNQSMMAAALGATFKRPERPAIEVGVLRNSYTTSGDHVLYDVFVRAKIGFLK